MIVTVRVEVEEGIRDKAARRLAQQGLTIDETMRMFLEQTAEGCIPNLGPIEPNSLTVEAIESARRGELVELGTPAEAIAELNKDE